CHDAARGADAYARNRCGAARLRLTGRMGARASQGSPEIPLLDPVRSTRNGMGGIFGGKTYTIAPCVRWPGSCFLLTDKKAMTQPAGPTGSPSHGNAYAARRMYDAYNRRDWTSLRDLLDENVDWFNIGRDEHVRGAHAVVELIRSTADAFPEARIELKAL